MEPAQGLLRPPPSVTDAVFELRREQHVDAVAQLQPKHFAYVPDDDDHLFCAVLRALKAWGRGNAELFQIVKSRLDRFDPLADLGVLQFDWSYTNNGDSPSEKRDIQRLRALVAKQLHERFATYYGHDAYNAAQLRGEYEALLAWDWTGRLSEAQDLHSIRQMLALKELAAMDGTSAYVRDGLEAALAYAARSEHACAKACLHALRQAYEAPIGKGHETRNAVVATTRMMREESPLVLLDVVADILGVHIDVYKYDEATEALRQAKCFYSVGPDAEDWDDPLPTILVQFQNEGLDGYPVLELVYEDNSETEATRMGYNLPTDDDVKPGSRHLLPAHHDNRDALQRFYVNAASGAGPSGTALVPAFVDPCAGQVDGLPGAAWRVWESVPPDAQEELVARVNAIDASLSPEPFARELGQWQRATDQPYEKTLNQVRDWVALRMWTERRTETLAQAAPPVAPPARMGYRGNGNEPKVPLRMRPFGAAQYQSKMRAHALTPEQEQWVRKQLQQASDSFIEHVSSRTGYGGIMLMTQGRGGPSARVARPTQGQAAAKSRQETKRMLKQLIDDARLGPEVAAQTQRISEEHYDPNLGGGSDKTLGRYAMGFRAALRLILSTKKLREAPAGPWKVLIKWWMIRDEVAGDAAAEANSKLDATKRWEHEQDKGKGVMAALGFIGGDKSSQGDRTRDHWQGLWYLLQNLFEHEGVPPYATSDELAAIDEADLPTWEDLGYVPGLRTQAPQ